jgi:hypothetical protein
VNHKQERELEKKKEREQENKEERKREMAQQREEARSIRIMHPAWFFIVGMTLVAFFALFWIVLYMWL